MSQDRLHAGYLPAGFGLDAKTQASLRMPSDLARPAVYTMSGDRNVRDGVMLDTVWTRMLDRTPAEIADLATEASRQSWMNYKAAGSVVEITFPGLLTPQEEKASNESD